METDLREFKLRWNNHHNTLISVLDTLLMKERLVDVTLAAEGQFINVHRIVLFACSQYFEDLLSQLPDKQAVVFLKDVHFADLKALVDYMYRGEVNVSQDRLDIFLQTADALKIKGLVDQHNHKKYAASLPEAFLPTSGTKARMNGLKSSHLSSRQYSSSVNTDESANSPAEDRSPSSPSMQMIEASLNEEEEPEEYEEERDFRQEEEEEEEMEPGVVVAEMEPDSYPFVSVNSKHGENMDSEFGDDHFEATENWSHQDAEDEYWNNSHEGFSSTSTTNNNSAGGLEIFRNPSPNDTAGPSRTRRKRPLPSTTTTSPTTRGPYRRRSKSKLEDFDDQKIPVGVPTATMDEAGVTTCTCGRFYTKRKNYIRHITFECGKEPSFACEYKDCTSRFKRKDNLKGHIDRVHLSLFASSY